MSDQDLRYDVIERIIRHGGPLDFILNRVDSVALDVVEWMPPEDNEKHHNAVEHLRRVHEEVVRIRSDLEAALPPVRNESR